MEAHHRYSSNLIPNTSTTRWKINDVDKIIESCCWTCMSFETEVPLGATMISKWRISLCLENNVLYCRSKLLSPNNEDVTHKVNITVIKNGEKQQISCDSDKHNAKQNCAKETFSRAKHPSLWKILCLDSKDLSEILSDDNTLELFIETIVYGNYTGEY